MSKYGDRATELFEAGYNCSQAVFGAFLEDYPELDFDAMMALSSSFGGGMGRMREVCGTVSGMFMAAGLKYGYSDPTAREEKTAHYERIRELAQAFRQENGSIICRELLGIPKDKKESPEASPRDEKFRHNRHCYDYVRQSAEIFAAYLDSHAKV